MSASSDEYNSDGDESDEATETPMDGGPAEGVGSKVKSPKKKKKKVKAPKKDMMKRIAEVLDETYELHSKNQDVLASKLGSQFATVNQGRIMYERHSKTQGVWYVCGKHNSIWESKTDDDISAEVTEFLNDVSLSDEASQAYFKCKGKW